MARNAGAAEDIDDLRQKLDRLEAELAAERSANDALRDSESLYRRLVELSPDAVYVHDHAQRIVFINQAGAALFGAAIPSQIIGSQVMRFIHPEYSETIERRIRQVLRTGAEVKHLAQRRLRLDGSDYYGDVAATAIQWQGRPGALVVVRDVTRNKRYEEKLHDSEAQYRKLVELSPEAIYVYQRGRIVFCNAADLKLYRAAEPSQMIGMGSIDLTHPDGREAVRARRRQVIEEGEAVGPKEQRRLRLDGTEFLAEVSAITFEWEGEPAALVVTRYITELKEAQTALLLGKENAELESRAKSEFLASMSHELRTPLNAIIGFSDIMQQEMFGKLGNEHYRSYASDIFHSGQHLHKMINDILDLSKIEAGKLELEEKIIEPYQAINRCLNLVRARADDGNISLNVRLVAGLPKLRADERKFKQTLINLLSNAVKFTKHGGRVTIAAERGQDRGLQNSVTDTGIGIEPADFDTVLRPFGQADSTLSRRYEGTGLGLPLTKSLVELHGGRLDLQSKPGAGTRVTVVFPSHRVVERGKVAHGRRNSA